VIERRPVGRIRHLGSHNEMSFMHQTSPRNLDGPRSIGIIVRRAQSMQRKILDGLKVREQ
jgi:hypothetical protein